jgi:hypothetical protein
VPDRHIQQYTASTQTLEAKMLFSRFAQTAAALLLLTIGLAAPAHAQNNQPIRSGNYYIDQAAQTVSDFSVNLTFAQTPTDKFTNITNISCATFTKAPQIVQAVYLFVGSTSGVNDLGRFYQIGGSVPSPEVAADGSKQYTVNVNGMNFKLGPGRYPTIHVTAPTSGTASITSNCVITANLTDN